MTKFTVVFVEVIILCSRFTSEQVDLEEGDPCVDRASGSAGVCARFANCTTAIRKWKLNERRPTICSFVGLAAVVCCEDAVAEPHTTQVPVSVQAMNTGKRMSELKCEEYKLDVNNSRMPPECWYNSALVIGGGSDADPGRYPHMAAVGWPSVRGGYEFKCGSTLISERYVLTAGHCTATSSRDKEVTSVWPTMIRLGNHDLIPDNNYCAQPVDVRIKRIVKHPNYIPPVNYNDIALLEMAQSVEFNPFVRPACLWQSDDFGGLDSAVVTGWGATAYQGTPSDVLLEVTLKLYSNDFCQPLLSHLINRKWKEGFSREQMCAGDINGLRDTCQGDSGGPLQVNLADNDRIFYVMGLTSFGYDCLVVNSPGIYTRVSSFVPWIESVVWPNGVQTWT